MNIEQIRLVQESFYKILPNSKEVAAVFYARLFELEPCLRPLFTVDMEEQGEKLISTLRLMVMGLNDIKNVTPGIESLARDHVKYGVERQHYEMVGEALLYALDNSIGDGFNSEVQVAWMEIYSELAQIMIDAAVEIKPDY